MLVMNGHRESNIPCTFIGDALYGATQTNHIRPFNQLAIFIGEGGFSDLTSIPDGNYPPVSWQMALDAGRLASHKKTQGVATVTGLAFWTMVGVAAGVATVTGSGFTTLQCEGTSVGTSTVTGTLSGIAWCAGQADGVATGSLTSYATGSLAGHIYVNQSEATVTQIVNGVWDAEVVDHETSGTMGNAVKSAGSAGDPWATELPGSYTGQQAGNLIKSAEKFAKLGFLK